jgi:hypothetical protein
LGILQDYIARSSRRQEDEPPRQSWSEASVHSATRHRHTAQYCESDDILSLAPPDDIEPGEVVDEPDDLSQAGLELDDARAAAHEQQLSDEFASLRPADATGAPLHPDLCTFIEQAIFGNSGEPAQLKAIIDRHPPPRNLPALCAPTINNELYVGLSRQVRARDQTNARTQQQLAAAVAPLAAILAELAGSKAAIERALPGRYQSWKAALTDSLQLISRSIWDLTMRRREGIRPSLTCATRGLCSKDAPVSQQLFGDNLSEEIRRRQATSRITIAATSSQPAGSRRQPHFRQARRFGRDSRRATPVTRSRPAQRASSRFAANRQNQTMGGR